ncbi:hypothetical protein Xmau_01490 [Xenorhabdus mauleonii]|uniref:DNA-3-methyladenine glycosylase II n=1 Tax=Xenorhabdus mauleonii TaxID=351675 RepID=A0A1I3PJT9_9GAMM|nr:hypothetical protein Xmau_01490 [Xenorhabdus mauleonii]SFJ21762.1 DNA-3-methyladenine glycosylase II [Xenorhabdus mauleonii]
MQLTDDGSIKYSTSLHDISRWTVEMLLIYMLKRTDIFSADDFGIHESYRRLKDMDKSPTVIQMRILGHI